MVSLLRRGLPPTALLSLRVPGVPECEIAASDSLVGAALSVCANAGVNALQKKSACVRNTGAQVLSVRSRHPRGRGGKSRLPIILKPSIKYCSQGKQYLDRDLGQDRLPIPSSILRRYVGASPAECEVSFSRTLKRVGCFLAEPRLASWKDQQ